MPRPPAILRAVLTALAAVAVAMAVVAPLPAPVAVAAPPTILVHRLDPLQTAPLSVQVAAPGPDGVPAAFTGTVTLSVGSTAAVATVASSVGGRGVARIDTSGLRSGSETLRARLRVAGRTRTPTLRWFAEIAPAIEVRGFSCAAVPPGGGAIRWAASALAGEPVRTPNSRDVSLLPYVPSSSRRSAMTGPDGAP